MRDSQKRKSGFPCKPVPNNPNLLGNQHEQRSKPKKRHPFLPQNLHSKPPIPFEVSQKSAPVAKPPKQRLLDADDEIALYTHPLSSRSM